MSKDDMTVGHYDFHGAALFGGTALGRAVNAGLAELLRLQQQLAEYEKVLRDIAYEKGACHLGMGENICCLNESNDPEEWCLVCLARDVLKKWEKKG